jgi:hypothetical protein
LARRLTVTLMFAAALVGAGCGGDDDGGNSSATYAEGECLPLAREDASSARSAKTEPVDCAGPEAKSRIAGTTDHATCDDDEHSVLNDPGDSNIIWCVETVR